MAPCISLGSWHTVNELVISWPNARFGCCRNHSVSVTNCVLYATTVYARHGDDHPESVAGDLRTCKYGSCTLLDGSALIWKPAPEKMCRYASVGKMRGHILGSVWLSDSKEFALSWTSATDPIFDCGKSLQVTDQGYATMRFRRSVRSTTSSAGIVTSNQLSAHLLAVEGSVNGALISFLRHAIFPSANALIRWH